MFSCTSRVGNICKISVNETATQWLRGLTQVTNTWMMALRKTMVVLEMCQLMRLTDE